MSRLKFASLVLVAGAALGSVAGYGAGKLVDKTLAESDEAGSRQTLVDLGYDVGAFKGRAEGNVFDPCWGYTLRDSFAIADKNTNNAGTATVCAKPDFVTRHFSEEKRVVISQAI
ncbi:MAG: hypothetical protein Q8K65_09280 [Alphaproteobacteria bacterium]|nr:hypothetical protein [Alphaproteobacteria bacterium]